MSDHLDGPETLTERVAARVVDVRQALDRRASASQPKVRRSPPEVESLKRVFRDMGLRYRRYRSQTGGAVVPGLRDAAYEFRAAPSLSSLVAVAVYLDKLDLLS